VTLTVGTPVYRVNKHSYKHGLPTLGQIT